ncbi:MAG TPA: GrpB family protein, partial [Polyangiales bacterium]|nr:GrpB family protein [Polyangiales bacterium]
NPWVGEATLPAPILIVDYDASWPAQYNAVVTRIRAALGDAVLAVEHIGSTAIPGLAAKPIIDIDLTLADPVDESAYVPALERAGFILRRREPAWHQHRLLRLDDPRTNLHVFGPDCPELLRHQLFREWLIAHPHERELYLRTKRAAAAMFADGSGTTLEYNRQKEPVIREIYDRIFRERGLLR